MPGQLGRFEVMRTLGSGASCKVKLALDTESGRKVALKIISDHMDPKLKELVMTELKAMGSLKHENIIEQIEYGVDTYVKKSGKSKVVSYIVLEIALGGELFDFVAISGRFSEDLARYFFKQFMQGLDHCHSNGVVHRDLKPENLLLDSQYTLKLADFGFAAPVEGRDGSGNLTTKLGTLNYMAPEIHLKQPYQGKSVDLFSAAIILFIMVSQHPPFTTAQPQDPFYRCLAANRADIFWQTHCKSKDNGDAFFSEEFKDLIQAMLQLDTIHRPSISEVLAHKWMQGPVPTKQQVIDEFETRQLKLKKNIEDQKAEKEAEKARRVQIRKTEVMRADDDPENFKALKNLDMYENVFSSSTEFFSTYNPDMIEDALLEHLRKNMKVEPKVHKDKYKVQFTLSTSSQEGQVQVVDIVMRILKVNDATVCVEFAKKDGDMIRFHEHFKEIKDRVLGFANDAVFA